MKQTIAIVDYSMGNLHSVYKKITKLNAHCIVSSTVEQILKADKIIIPGVGHFSKAVENLKSMGLWDVLNEIALIQKKPILGICLGMQLMAKKSEEGNVDGFGWLDAEVVRFKVSDEIKFKVPHIGWNQISITKDSKIMKGLDNTSEFYFVHSYHFKNSNKIDILNETEYDYTFTSAVEKENIFGVQYHPEKSHDAGETVLKNFIEL